MGRPYHGRRRRRPGRRLRYRGGGRKVDHDVRPEQARSRVGGGDDPDLTQARELPDVLTEVRVRIRADGADDLNVRGGMREPRDGEPHAAGGSEDCELHGASKLFMSWASRAWQPSVASTIGKRTVGSIKPFAASAALMGAGLGSVKKARCSR